MNEDYKARIINALKGAEERRAKKLRGPTRKNSKPEKQVEKDCLKLVRAWGWSVEIYEAKATKGEDGIWRNQAMKAGTLDCMGATEEGISAVVEFKAPGKLSTLSDSQRKFLITKINANCFGCVTDSVDRLRDIYLQWRKLKYDREQAKRYLLSMLPKEKAQDDSPLFDED